MIDQHLILAGGWILFCFFHSFLASISFKQWLAQKLGNGFSRYRLYYTLFATSSFLAVLFLWAGTDSFFVFSPGPASKIVGLAIGSAGLIIMGNCILKYFGRLSGLKTLFSNEVKSGNALIITGIHRFIRHPLYAGTFLFIWGAFLFFPYCSMLISDSLITLYTLVGIRFEEQKLIREFGERYIEYKRKVPMLIPTGTRPVR